MAAETIRPALPLLNKVERFWAPSNPSTAIYNINVKCTHSDAYTSLVRSQSIYKIKSNEVWVSTYIRIMGSQNAQFEKQKFFWCIICGVQIFSFLTRVQAA